MSQKPKICLSMIVKNEAHIIKQTLQNISKYVDYYVINDTGSTDNTREVIKEYFDSINIQGEIIDHEFRTCNCHMNKWKKYSFFHFGWNRTFAMQQCVNKGDYIFVFDADDLIVGNMKFENLTEDCYDLRIGKNFTYARPLLFKNDPKLNWRFEDPLHEFATCDKPNHSKGTISGDYHIESRRLGDRSKDKNKYLRDAQVFEEMLQENPNNDRHTFYCAQSHYDNNNHETAIKYYKKRISMGKWYEEVFYSYYKIAEALVHLKRPWAEIKKAYLDAYNYCKDRSEPLHNIAKYYRENKNYKQGYKYAKIASSIPYPDKCVLFIYKDVYDYKVFDELCINAFYLEKYNESYSIANKLITSKKVPIDDIKRITNILQESKKKLDQIAKKSCFIYTGNISINQNTVLSKLIKVISKTHKVFIIGNKIDPYFFKDIYIVTTKQMNQIKQQVETDYLILCDCVDYYYENYNITAKSTVLLQQDELIKNSFENGLLVGIKNSYYLNNIFEKLKINQIVCKNKEVADNLIITYGLDKDKVSHMNFEDQSDYYVLFEDIKENSINKYTFNLNIDNETNGLVYLEPQCLQYMRNNRQSYVFTNELIINYYTELSKKQPANIEHIGKVAQTYLELKDTVKALSYVDMAIGMIKENKMYQEYKDTLQLFKAKILYENEKWHESYDLCNLFLQKNTISDNTRKIYEELRNSIATEHMLVNVEYNQNVIKNIKKTNNNKIMFATSNKDSISNMNFETTINSFLNCCNDYSKIDYWACINEDSKKGNKKYPFFDYIYNKDSHKGKYTTLNMIIDKAISGGFSYLIYVDPDWHFVQKRDYITECLKILDNVNYVSLNKLEKNIKSNITSDNTRYITGLPSRLGPSIIKVDTLKEIGKVCNSEDCENLYISELASSKLASIDTVSSICLSLSLNPTKNIIKATVAVKIISNNDPIIWKRFKDSAINQLPNMTKVIIDSKINLSEEEKSLFIGNNFNYLRSTISNILPHIEILKQDTSEYTLVLNENVVLEKECKNILNSIVSNKTKYDFIILDEITESNDIINKKDVHVNNFEQLNGYIISKDYKKKLLEYIQENKITNTNYLNGCVINTHVLNKKLFNVPKETNKSDKSNESNEFVELEGYKFYSLMDSYGEDAGSYGKINLEELKKICDNEGNAGFNTLGWVKSKICVEKDFIILPNTTNPADGLYVKI